ncbi:MAG: beta-ketoacyl-[acyl-carrier-protein] synthase family protein [Myxococcota bacterium]
MPRLAITGVGVISPLGLDAPTTWAAMTRGESGVSFLDGFDTSRLRSDIAAQVRGFSPEPYLTKKEAEIYGRVTQFSLAAATEAIGMAGLGGFLRAGAPGASSAPEARPSVAAHRIGCLFSTGQGSVDIFEAQIARSVARGPRAVSPFFIPGVMPNSGAALITMRYGFMGPSFSLNSACTTGAHSVATCGLMIEAGEADVMVAGGAEAALRQNTVAGFGNARALTKAWEGDPTRASRPFDAGRRGFVMGEGAGALVVEDAEHARRRGAQPLAYLAGWGLTSDAQHLTQPHPEGLGVKIAVERALERAGIGPEDIDYINPHATSTVKGDLAEVEALRTVFGDRLRAIPISATKSMVGHLLGGAAAVESVAVVYTLRDQCMHPSINLEQLDPAFDLDVVTGAARPGSVRYALKVSAGFGGHNCALVYARA